MNIEEYRKDFLEQIRSDAAINSTDPNEEFIQKTIDLLVENEEFPDPIIHYFGSRGRKNRMMQFNAFGFDEADGSVCLLISDFNNSETPVALTNTQIDTLYSRMKSFIEEAYQGNISDYCDESDQTIDIARQIRKLIGKTSFESSVLKFKFFIITNSVLSSRVKYIQKEKLYDRPVEVNLWYLERFYDLYTSVNSEAIEINVSDFGIDGIQCIRANMTDCDEYDAYLAIVPGKFLADIYLKHGSRLLQGNVRAFLSLKNAVNKGIRKTIISDPKKFFTYNNGIATISQSVELSNDGNRITSFKGLQIINGGQTTASMASAVVKKDNEQLENIFVPMKLTVLKTNDEVDEEENDKQYNEMIRNISECANSQTKVTPADFFSNHKFHVIMETLSLSAKNFAPPVNGNPFPTVWFYERSRGKWEQEQMKLTQSERDKFIKKHPKNQVVKKEQLIKCMTIMDGHPYTACDISSKMMKLIASKIDDICENSVEQLNDYFFKKSIVSIIIYNSIEKLVGKQSWYPKGGNRAQIVPYTIAKIMASIPDNKTIDYDLIWKAQSLYPSFVYEVENVSLMTHKFLENSGGIIVREYARQRETWNKYKNATYEISEFFYNDLKDLRFEKEDERQAKKERKFNNDIDASVDVYNLGAGYWMNVYNKVENEKVINYNDKLFIKSIAELIGRNGLPSAAQSKKLIKIFNIAEDAGFIFE
ncbi:MAG: AIPR family protein [Ignavibacteriales bacterium]|nr:AIPR family protein [Ignavibacteriales bacterium]